MQDRNGEEVESEGTGREIKPGKFTQRYVAGHVKGLADVDICVWGRGSGGGGQIPRVQGWLGTDEQSWVPRLDGCLTSIAPVTVAIPCTNKKD